MTREEYWFWLCNCPDIYQQDIQRLLKVFDSPEELFKADSKVIAKELLKINGPDPSLNRKQLASLLNTRGEDEIKRNLEKRKNEGVSFVSIDSPEYPKHFDVLTDKPYAIYVKGKLPEDNKISVGMVGARNCSGYGKTMAGKFAKALAVNDVQIISGMAVGIDTVSSRSAIIVGGKTFVVLGSGIDYIYPRENIELYYDIIFHGGGIISEYPFGSKPIGWQFPHRNRLISAFSDYLLIMEARKQSGTLTTAEHALRQGKDIFALPGRVTDSLSESCNTLISEGAGMLSTPEHFIQYILGKQKQNRAPELNPQSPILNTDQKVRLVYSVLNFEPKIVQQVMEETHLEPEETAEILMELELSGLIKEVGKDYYVRED
ncbi:MAG: DNA-processing protein DprA [Lachnospiraceae bacterium]|nr:DNA-processing protein DprA [Lachnospiraceae bacterium]